MSLALYSFDGSVRRDKASEALVDDLKSRERFLAKINQERDERAQITKRQSAAVKIQSYYRSFAARKGVKAELRLAFDRVCAGSKNNKVDVKTLNEQIARLILFHSPATDQQRLVWTCQTSLAAAQTNGRDAIVASKRFPLYKCCLRHLEQISGDANAAFAPALRLLEVFAFVDDAETARLVSVGYFACIRRLFERRVPLPLDEHLEIVNRLPNPMAEGIASSLLRPIIALKSVQDEAFRHEILRRFCLDVLDGDDPRHVVCYLLPYIGQQIERHLMPFADLLASLLPHDWWQFLSEDRKAFLSLKVQSPVLFGYALLYLASWFPLEGSTARVRQMYLLCVSCTLQAVTIPAAPAKDNDDDDDDNYMDVDDYASRTPGTPEFLLRKSVQALQTPKVREALLSAALEPPTSGAINCLARVCYFASGLKKRGESDSALIYSLSFKTEFIRRLWHLIRHCTSPTIFGQPRPLLDNLVRGMSLGQDEKDRLIPLLSLFCSLMINTLLAVHDDEFFREESDRPLTSLVPFAVRDLCSLTEKLRNVALGLIDLAFPDSRTDLIPKIGIRFKDAPENPLEWNILFDLVVRLLQLLHERDARLQFMAQDFWSNHNRKVVVNRQVFHSRRRGVFRQRERPFAFVRWLTHEEMEGEDGTQPTAVDLRNVTIMRRIPFVVPFLERVQIFHELLNHDKQDMNRMDEWGGGALHHGDAIYLRVRRNYLYEDAFENLSTANAPNIKKQIRVSMINWAGLDEAGIDGGGIFREFLSELLKSGFDPQRGFFTTTPHDRLLYPNPVAVNLFPDDFSRHYYFLGRMLGKLIYENQMAELRFASFFLAKLLHKNDDNVDIHHLASLDPDLYKNLLYVKQYSDDVSKLELDFSVVVEHLGQTEKIDLKSGGSNIRVDNSNRIEYIHLLANFYLNERLRPATRAMRAGLSDVLDLDWLGMFDHRELQILISGADSDVDVADMRKFVVVHNIQTDDDNRIVDNFWQVVQSFSPVEKRMLLKFVTGCSRPPLMGFKDLYPPMGIQLIPDSDRLPSAATCMNLLKLPKFRDQQTMYTKLAYAIEAGAGFELS